jgi:membrane protein DedA with SNARE-associated domain
MLASVTGSITSAIGNHGVYAVFGLMALDAVFPAASELVMLYAGALAAGAFAGQHVVLFGGHISSHPGAYVVMSLAGTLGYLLGGIVGWAIGSYGGRPLLDRHGRLFHLGHEQLARAERWFDRWGELAVFLGRITPVVRSFISIPAGVFEMPLVRYIVWTLLGSAVWAFAFAGAGWGLGTGYEHVHRDFRFVDYAVVALVVVAAVALIALFTRSSRLRRRAPDSAG